MDLDDKASSFINAQRAETVESIQELGGERAQSEGQAPDRCLAIHDGNAHFADEIPRPPPYLRKTARVIWHEFWALSTRPEIIEIQKQTGLVARYCANRANLEAMLKKNPPATFAAISTAGGNVIKPNPAFAAMMDLQRLVLEIEARLGVAKPRAKSG